jgi:hypothetical protein
MIYSLLVDVAPPEEASGIVLIVIALVLAFLFVAVAVGAVIVFLVWRNRRATDALPTQVSSPNQL